VRCFLFEWSSSSLFSDVYRAFIIWNWKQHPPFYLLKGMTPSEIGLRTEISNPRAKPPSTLKFWSTYFWMSLLLLEYFALPVSAHLSRTSRPRGSSSFETVFHRVSESWLYKAPTRLQSTHMVWDSRSAIESTPAEQSRHKTMSGRARNHSQPPW
jgi:hypothetical protein